MAKVCKSTVLIFGVISILSCSKSEKKTMPIPTELPLLNLNVKQDNQRVFINQLAYHPDESKRIVVIKKQDEFCSVFDQNQQMIAMQALIDLSPHPDYSVELAVCDLTALREEGGYILKIGDVVQDLKIYINGGSLRSLLEASQKTFYYQRASFPLDELFAGSWARPDAHPDRGLTVRLTGGNSEGTRRDVPGGWYDAGDYGKYVVNGGIAVGTLLLAIEHFPESFGDNIGIPESGNGVSDLLDEIRYELDWFLSMQDDDGGVFFKVGPLVWPGMIMPHEDIGERFITGKSTASTLNFAAVSAQASRIFLPFSEAYAEELLAAAERAWRWAIVNPNVLAPQPDAAGTGSYWDERFQDEFMWAAIELARVTGQSQYREIAQANILQMKIPFSRGEARWWQNVQTVGFLSMAYDKTWSQEVMAHVHGEIISYAENIYETAKSNPFRISYSGEDFIWGSNGGLANQAMILLNAERLTGENRFRRAAQDILHYFMGRNIHSRSFVTGLGQRSPLNPHHRPSGGDSLREPIPGFLVGGPNYQKKDLDSGVIYPINAEGPYCYVDQEESYASNEVAINWNAPLTYLAAGLQKLIDK